MPPPHPQKGRKNGKKPNPGLELYGEYPGEVGPPDGLVGAECGLAEPPPLDPLRDWENPAPPPYRPPLLRAHTSEVTVNAKNRLMAAANKAPTHRRRSCLCESLSCSRLIALTYPFRFEKSSLTPRQAVRPRRLSA